MRKKMKLTTKIFYGLLGGVIFGLLANAFLPLVFYSNLEQWILAPIGTIFIRAIRMLVVPLVLISLICGSAGIGDPKKLGRVGGKTILFYLTTTAIAITIGLLLASIISPGTGISIPSDVTYQAKEAPFIMDIFTNMVPTNPINSLANAEMLQIIIFAILFGIALANVGKKAEPLINLLNMLNDVLMKMIELIMTIAPYGVFALISKVIATQGIDILLPLLKYMLTVLFALFLHTLLTYTGALSLIGKANPITFFKKFASTMVVAFSTSSSSATLPVTIETAEKELGVSNEICSFTLPLGATINMDGTAIMQGVATIFIAQVFGVHLTFSALLMVILTATLASVGTAGVPGVGLITLSMVLQSVGLPIEGIALIIGVDRILDMTRTAVNITGDTVCSVIVANSENEFNRDVFNA